MERQPTEIALPSAIATGSYSVSNPIPTKTKKHVIAVTRNQRSTLSMGCPSMPMANTLLPRFGARPYHMWLSTGKSTLRCRNFDREKPALAALPRLFPHDVQMNAVDTGAALAPVRGPGTARAQTRHP
jgi:hypothetical protein